jgi:hypothetical protein
LRATKELRIIARPLICADCRSETLISRLNMVPSVEEPRRIAAGWGCPSGGRDVACMGTIPS